MPLMVVGVIIFLGSELMFFAAMFGMYFTLRADNAAWPPRGTELDLLEPAVATTILVASSFTMQLAVRRMAQGEPASMKRWIWITFVMGSGFLALQAHGYAKATFQIDTSAYGSAFYAMTGFHALHVAAGLAAMLVVLGRAAAGAYTPQEHAGLEAATYYWHFVDVVWVFLFLVIFVLR
jgi:cytochrome c oxidase subunit III